MVSANNGLLTVAALAKVKRLPEEFLLGLGMRDTREGVAIPYYDLEGKLLFERTRLSLEGEKRFHQPAGVPLAPYGLSRFANGRKPDFLILVEGESDTWTLCYAGIAAALGLPGASTASKLEKEHLKGVKQVYVIHEPGYGGDAFEVSCGYFKDPSDLYCDDPLTFCGRFEAVLSNAQVLVTGRADGSERVLGFRSLDDYLAAAQARREKEAFWEGILRTGEVSLIVGRAMAGKSTFACALARSLTSGTALLGRRCRRVRVGYMALERNGLAVAQLLKKWGVEDIVILDEAPALKPDDLAAFLGEQIVLHHLSVIMVDHLQNLVRVADANDYARVSLAFEPFHRVAKETGAHLGLLHHQGKTRRDGEIDVMGSEAFRCVGREAGRDRRCSRGDRELSA